MSIEINIFGWLLEIGIRHERRPCAFVRFECGPITVWSWAR